MSLTELEESRIRDAYACRRDGRRFSPFCPGHLFLLQDRERHTLALLKRQGIDALDAVRILEIGCGTGYWVREFIKWGARPENITGLDLLPDRVREARTVCPSGVAIECGNAAALAYPDGAFDLVLQSTVFTSILDPVMKRDVASEMLRIVKTDGLILWYDFHIDNPNNPDVKGVKRREIHRLFPRCRIYLTRITPAPPLLRLVAPYSWLCCHLLGRFPWACTHYLGAIRKLSA